MIPEPGNTNLNFVDFVILLGVVQGILLAVTGLFRQSLKEKFKSLLFFAITCIIAEIFLNRTGYMYYVIPLVDFSEPLQFAVPPLIYLIILSINPETRLKKWGLHFIPFVAYLIFFMPFYLAPNNFKLENYYFMHHFVEWKSPGNYQLLQTLGNFRKYQMFIFFFQTTIYMVLSFQTLLHYRNNRKELALISQLEVNWFLIFNGIITLLIAVVLIVKMTYFRDIGDHIIATFLTAIIYLSTITELIKPSGSLTPASIQQTTEESIRPTVSGIKEEKKQEIQEKLTALMDDKKLYTDSLISVGKLAKQIGEPAYVISQVINEKMDATFYDWIAQYRVEEAKRLMTDPKTNQYTVEQIAEEVGYNSKSAFNKAFKKFTKKTPSEYRTNNNSDN
jgi:AraC-like DNA-binding protein